MLHDPAVISGKTVQKTFNPISTLHYSSVRVSYTVNLTAATSGYWQVFGHNGSWTMLCDNVRIRHGNNDNNNGVSAPGQARLTDNFSGLGANKASITLKMVLDDWNNAVWMGDVLVEAYKDDPIANAQDVVDTTQDTPTASVALAVSDPQNQTLTPVVSSGPSNGTLSWTGTSFVYTPNSCFHGNDSFDYHVVDPFDQVSATRTITINVARANSPITVSSISNVEMKWNETKSVLVSEVKAGACGSGLTISAASDDADIVLVPSVEYNAPDEHALIKLKPLQPVRKQTSVNTITIQVNDGHNDPVVRTFNATVKWNALFRH